MILRQNIGLIPGGIRYQDPRTAKANWTDDHTFLADRVREVIAFRRANPTVYPESQWLDVAFVTQQVVEYNCTRLGNNPQYCFESPTISNISTPPPVMARVCPDCGIVMTERLCATCSGRKVIGYKCHQCGKEQAK